MADLLARGLRAQPPLLDQAVMTAPVSVDPAGGASQAERGLRSSLAAQSAGALAAEGLSAEIAGRRDVAAEKYRQAELMKAQAGATAPRVTSLRDVGSADDLIDFAAGGLPQVLTSTVPALAGALVGRGIGGRIGAVAGGMVPAYNMEANETAGELAMDPQARARMTPEQIQSVMRTKGALNAGLEVAGPAYLIERAIGKTATREGLRGAAKTVGMGALLEGPGTELPQEIIGQGAKSYARTGSPTQEIDPWALADATALGTMGGGTLAVPAAGVQLGREALSKSADAAKQGTGRAADAVGKGAGIVLDAAAEKADPILDQIKSRAGAAFDSTKMDWLVANTEQIPDEIAGDTEAVMQHIAGQDAQRKQYITDYLTNIVNTAEDPARVAQASDMLNKLDDPETFRVAARGIVTMEKTKQFQQRVREFEEDAKDFAKGFVDGPKKKANAQGAFGTDKLDPTNQLITQGLVDALPPEAADAGADKLIPFFRGMFSGKVAPQLAPRIMRDFIGIYGDRAVEVAAQVSQLVTRDSEGRGLDSKRTVSLLQDFMADEEVRMQTRQQALEDSLTNEARLKLQTELGRPVQASDLAAVGDLMTRHVEGTLSKQMAPRVEKELKNYLGDRFQHVSNIFRAMHDAASRKSAPLVHAEELADAESTNDTDSDALDYDEQREAQSFETMMDGKDREFSLASKATSGVGKMFDSREEAQMRWDDKIAPVHTNRSGRVIRGDEYAVLSGTDPLALAAQYDAKFSQQPADFKARAALAKEAMTLLRDKYAVQMDHVTNEDKDSLSEKDLATVLAKSQLPVREVEKPFKNDGRYVHVESEGKHFAKDTKPRASDGYIFVAKPDGKFRAVKMSALVYAITGKQQKEVFGGTADDVEGAPAKLRTVATALARVGDTKVLDLAKGAFTYNDKGEQQWLVRPGADQTAPVQNPTNTQRKAKAARDRAALDKLTVGKSTVGGLREKAESSYVAKRKAERDKVRGVLEAALYEKIENAEARLEELREELADAKASGIKAAIVDASNKVNAAKIAINKLNNYEITEADIDSKMMERDQTRAAERDGKTDTDPMLQASSDTRSMQEGDANFADVQRRTNAQNRYSGKARREANATKTEQVAEKESAALGKKEATRLTQNANKTVGYLNNPPADYTPEKAVAAKEWAQRWLTRTMGMTDVEDLRASLALVDKVASQMIEGDKAVAKMEGKRRKKANAMSTQIHDELDRDGIAATHDSPIRHEGKFDWRKHQGKGEGNAAFGAGTYLSTANSVHRSYKNQFTAEMKGTSFTWGDSLFERGEEDNEIYKDGDTAMTPAENVVAYEILVNGKAPEEALKYARERAYWIAERSAEDAADHISASEPSVTAKELSYVLSAFRNYKPMEPDKVASALKPFFSVDRWNKIIEAANRKAQALADVDVSGISIRADSRSPTYHVTVNVKQDELLDWNAPLSEQSAKVQKALTGGAIDITAPDYKRANLTALQAKLNARKSDPSGQLIYSALVSKLGSQAKASDYLQSLGILGHVYNAAGGKEAKFRNYVIYDDSKIQTNYVSFSKQRAGKVATDEEVTAAFEYAKTVLGDKIQVIFEKDLGGLSGEWEEGDLINTIRVALNAGPGVLSVAHHEAMHEFFARLTKAGREDVKDVLLSAANSPTVVRKLERLLDSEPAALKQLKSDPEERLAYMYQFWAAGELTVGPNTNTLFEKIAKFFRRIAGMLTADDRVNDIMTAFHEGKMAEPSAAARALDEIMSAGETAVEYRGKLKPLFDKAYGFVMPASDVMADSDNPHAKEIGRLMHTSLTGENNGEYGYLNAMRAKTAEWDNRFAAALGDLDAEEVALLREVLSTGKKTNFAPVNKAAKEMRTLLRDFRNYMRDRGVDIGYRKDYFPRVWNFEAIAENPEAFKAMMLKHYTPVLEGMAKKNNEAAKKSGVPNPDDSAEAVAGRIVTRMSILSGVEQDHGDLQEKEGSAGFTPYMQAVNEMKLDFVEDAHAQEFLEQDLVRIMTSYLKQGVRRAEYENRFGAHGARLASLLTKSYDYELEQQLKHEGLLDDVNALRTKYEDKDPVDVPTTFELINELAGKEKAIEITDAAFSANKQYTDATHAMEGTLGYDKIGPKMRKFNSWMLTYQNIRLLPLVLFSSMIDPLGMLVRGGTLDDTLAAYRRGVAEVLASWTGKESRDGGTRMAELLGVIEHQSFLDSLGYVQESMYMNSKAKKLSDQFFKLNGMEAWNRAVRTQATVAAVDFIKDHTEHASEHSDRWLAELGLKRSDVHIKDGELVLFKQDFVALGMSEGEAKQAADKMQLAVNQWVDGSMLRPNAALRPSWSSDPRWSLLFYLKQFTYAFQKTYISRVRNEYRYGNTAPMVAMLPFIPVMIAADVARGLIQNGGDLPNYMKSWNVGDYLMHGVQRAGLTGLAQFGIDEATRPADIFGPVVGQGIDLFTKPMEKNATEAIPVVAALT